MVASILFFFLRKEYLKTLIKIKQSKCFLVNIVCLLALIIYFSSDL